MDCKNRSVEISLAHCTGKGGFLAGIEHDPSATLSLHYLCFLVASLIKAMKYCGNPDSENPVSFESVSAALSNICSNKVSHASWHSGVIRKIRM